MKTFSLIGTQTCLSRRDRLTAELGIFSNVNHPVISSCACRGVGSMDLPVWYTDEMQILKREVPMQKKRPTEQELLKDLDAYGAHADKLARPLPHESEPLERLKGSVKKFEQP